jgi:hypothetical protein
MSAWAERLRGSSGLTALGICTILRRMFEIVGKVDGGARVLRCASLVVSVHPRASTVEDLRFIHGACQRIAAEHTQMCSLTLLLQAGMGLDGPTRDAAKALASDFRDVSIGQAIVYGGEGLQASLVRSVLTGVNLLARARAPQRVFTRANEAVRWLSGLPQQVPELRDAERVWAALECAEAAVAFR